MSGIARRPIWSTSGARPVPQGLQEGNRRHSRGLGQRVTQWRVFHAPHSSRFHGQRGLLPRPRQPDPDDPLDGQLAFVDPRYNACCRDNDKFMTTPFMPKLPAGSMIIFPSTLVHCVNPYRSSRRASRLPGTSTKDRWDARPCRQICLIRGFPTFVESGGGAGRCRINLKRSRRGPAGRNLSSCSRKARKVASIMPRPLPAAAGSCRRRN